MKVPRSKIVREGKLIFLLCRHAPKNPSKSRKLKKFLDEKSIVKDKKFPCLAGRVKHKLMAYRTTLEDAVTPFSYALLAYRRRAGLSQTNLAKRLGVAIQYVWKLEHGVKPPPSPEQIGRIATALELSEADVASLLDAARDSQKKFNLPDDLHSDALRVINRLVRAATSLKGDDVHVLDEFVERLER
ncbi:helix-turn-helix domain-containing protein [Burkholderia ubonensis]|uniref:helix-turn-helix domain-containing protein n=1 Tax=Burkholderia ubonensis TaxID=101571 RepID=UPI000A80481D|nr:helix-turn-helix transcriptional regulator [Burkholderia ubonensis]